MVDLSRLQASIAVSTSTQKKQNVARKEQTRTATLVEASSPSAVLIGLAIAILGLVVFMPYAPREYGNSPLSDDNEEFQGAADIPDEADDTSEEANADDEEDSGDDEEVEPSVEKT